MPNEFLSEMPNWVGMTLKNDASKHVIKGYMQYDCIHLLRAKMEGPEHLVLENYVEHWDHTNPFNVNVVPADAQELQHVPWRRYYKALAVYTMRLTNITNLGAALAAPNSIVAPILKPPELKGYLTVVDTTFQAAQATYLQDVKEFKAMPRDSLMQMVDRYDELAMSLLGARDDIEESGPKLAPALAILPQEEDVCCHGAPRSQEGAS